MSPEQNIISLKIMAAAAKVIAICILVYAVPSAVAGPRVNNGGGGWACRNQHTGKIEWLETLDLTGQEFKAGSGDEWEQYSTKLKLIAEKVPNLQALLSEAPQDIQKEFIVLDHAIETISDGAVASKPLPGRCESGDIEFAQIADFLTTNTLVVDGSFWNDPSFLPTQKAALLLHERLYFAFRHRFGDETSWRTQQVVALLFTKSSTKNLSKEIDYYLADNMRDGDQNIVALFPVHLLCQATLMSLDQNPTVLDSKSWGELAYGSEQSTTLKGLTFHLRTSAADGTPALLEITDARTGTATSLTDVPLQTLFLRNRIASLTFDNRTQNQRAFLECWNPK